MQVLVLSLVLHSRPDSAEQACQDQEMDNSSLCCAAQLCYHIWEHQTTLQRARVSDPAQDLASCTIFCSLTGEAVPICLPSAPGCADLRGHPSQKWSHLSDPFLMQEHCEKNHVHLARAHTHLSTLIESRSLCVHAALTKGIGKL